MNEPVSIVVVGGAGRMGRAVLSLLAEEPDLWRPAVVDHAEATPGLPGNPPVFKALTEALHATSQGVVLDVSLAAGAAERVRAAAAAGWPVVEGTTGLDRAAEDALADAARRVAVVRAPNFSAGAALLRRAAAAALAGRGPAWDVAILDRHHRAKKDAPSGTAKLLAETVREATGVAPEIASFRQGSVVGEHVIHLAGADEELVLTHRAFSRGALARGALLAVRFAQSAPSGLYGMNDVLGLTG